ncbi:ribonuclease HII [Lacinutrix sp. C3R15]|uniref:ribonuclease HII n=1 Tax=Flavobacteriaceae TaxID=49546 RepID=UPI001C088302|nr:MULTISPECIES: ribonuclease HII [Flavobacteriaceae]MBU2939429.1 ribonuclease HII [Lacinutrix sp. C3R15]MDO6622744.1 ribonuclease HII [Oceanihabitans sp. 1_MG-2023]
MKKIWSIFLLTTLFISCNTTNKHINTTDYIPENASVILQVNNLESLKSNLENNDFLEGLSNSASYTSLSKKLKNLTYLNTTNPLFVCFNYDKKDSLQYTVITKQTPDLFAVDSLQNIKIETYVYQNLSVNKTQIEENITYNTFKDSLFIASSSKDLLETLLVTTNKDEDLKTILKTSDTKKTFSILVNNKYKEPIKSVLINDSISFGNFTQYTLVDADINQDAIILNGITKATDSTKSLINIFKNTIAKENKTASIAPSNADGFMSFTFNVFSVFNENLKQYNSIDSILPNTTLFDNVIEVGVIYEGKNRAIILNSLDIIATQDALLNEQNLAETYRQIAIYNFSEVSLFNDVFSPLITFKNANYYANINDFFVFTNTKEVLENIIANYQNKTTFSEKDYYKSTKEHLTDASSLLVVANPSSLKNIINNNLKEDLNLKLEDYKTSALQFVYDTNFAHVNAIIKKSETKARENSVTEQYNIKLEADLINNPQLVTNHITKQKEIVVQDINNHLYLISNRGKVLWKKQLQGAILGEVQQIDMYKNGRLQLAFVTPNRLYVLDRNGKDVAPFPLKFKDKITQPLSVFDYDKNKKYRLLVTQDKNVLMYDAKGKTVKGFNFSSAESTINHQPQHFRIGRKDYLTFKTDNKLYILDRVGKTRVTPKNKYLFSNQALYLYNNKFTTTTKDGKLVHFDTKGNSATQNLNLGKKHHLVTTTKTLVAQTENKLTIKNKTLDLDFGNYDTPKLFYINNKIYVSVTDLQTQKVYLYDSNAILQNNFPVYGNSAIALDNLDKDSNLEFVTKGENNTIIIYQIN